MAAVMKEQTFHGRSLEVSLWKRILHHLMEFKQTMIWLILANVVVAATDVALPMFSQYAINELVLNQGNDDQIVWFAFAYLITVAVQCLSIYLFSDWRLIWKRRLVSVCGKRRLRSYRYCHFRILIRRATAG